MADEETRYTPRGEPVAKLTDWAKEPPLSTLKKDVEAARPVQKEQISKITVWLDNLHVTGSAKIKPREGRSGIQPKLIRKHAEWRYSSLSEPFLSADKVFTINPTTWEDKDAAEQNELVLNWQFRTKLNAVTFVDDYVHTAVDEGTVAVRVGWERETKMVKVMAPVYQYVPMLRPEQIQALQEATQLQQENPNAFLSLPAVVIESVKYSAEAQMPMLAIQIGEEEVEQEKVLKNRPTAEVINIANLVVDATCGGDPDKSMFMAYSSEITRGALRSDKRYKNVELINWSASPLTEPDFESTGPSDINFDDKARQKVVLNEWYGLYDIEGEGHLTPIYVAWVGDVMVRCELNPYPDGKPPFVIVPYLPKKKSFYGEPDGELLTDNQKVLGAVTRGVIDTLARSANGQRGMAKNMLDVVNQRRFDKGDDYQFNPNIHPANGVIEHTYPDIPVSALNLIQMQNLDAESLSGVKAFSGGGINGNALGSTATGANGALSAASLRETGILRRLAKGMTLIGMKILAMNQDFMSEEEVIRVTNEKFVTVRREDLKGEFDLECAISTPEEDNAKAQELAFMLQTAAQSMEPHERRLLMAEIARLRRMPQLAHQLKNYKPEPDPLQQKMQELQIAKLEAEIGEIRAKAMERQAQAQREMAQARALNSGADKTDLDFVNDQTGVTHSRRMDELGEQSEANQRLAITKGILEQRPEGAHNPESSVPDAPDKDALLEAFGFSEMTKTRPPQQPAL